MFDIIIVVCYKHEQIDRQTLLSFSDRQTPKKKIKGKQKQACFTTRTIRVYDQLHSTPPIYLNIPIT